MKLHHIRNATLLIETKKHGILVDPMLGGKASLPPFALFRYPRRRNPTVELPDNWPALSQKVTHCLITHLHPDHLDAPAIQWLLERDIPVYCSHKDAPKLHKAGLRVVQSIAYNQRVDFLDGKIEGIPARHGYGFVAIPAGNVMGFYLELPEEPSLYISADTILTDAVKNVLQNYQPYISVVAGGSAQFDLFKPLLMMVEDLMNFIELAPQEVFINHLEALNHCPTTRAELRALLTPKRLLNRVFIPEDGAHKIYKYAEE